MKLLAALTTLALVSCANSDNSSSDAPYARLQLTGTQAGKLKLSGSALDSGYAADYPNPRGIVMMEVVVGPRGKVVGVCRDSQGVSGHCGDVPFFARVRTTAEGRVVEAWDLHGELVLSYSCSSASDGLCGPAALEQKRVEEECGPNGGGDGDGDGDDGGDGDGDGGGDGGGDDGDGGGDDGGDGDCPPPPTDCAAVEDWARACFCKKVNDQIDDVGIEYTVDCNSLDSNVEFPEFDDDYEGEVACGNDIIDECEDDVEDGVEDTECEDVEDALHNWASAVDYQLRSMGLCGHSPLVLDLAGNGIALSSLASGTRFDLLGTGAPVACSWIQGDDAFLAFDRNNSGTIDGAAELFGNATDARSFSDGFAALAELDADRNGRIDAVDPAYGSLQVWNDANRDGIGTSDELRSLSDVGVTTLSLSAERVSGKAAFDGRGNRIPLVSSFGRADGSSAALVDAFLRYVPSSQPVASTVINHEKLTCELLD